jgi:putative holliday junction resolvase
MPRLLAIDYGLKRVGIAVTDPLQIIAHPLTTVENAKFYEFIKDYVSKEEVEAFVIGEPFTLSGGSQEILIAVKQCANKLKQLFPTIPIHFQDERYTSQMAMEAMIMSGVKKSKRRDKKNLDTISAAIILQAFMEQNN